MARRNESLTLMGLRRSLLILVLVGVVVASLPGSVGADAENLTVADVTIDPNPPAPGEPFRLTTTIENNEGGSGSVEITDLYIRTASGLPEYERVENLGSLGDGQSTTVPLQLTLDQSRNLRVHVTARAADGELIRLEYPVYVTVEEPEDVQLSFSTGEPVAGIRTNVTITVANGDKDPIANLQLDVESAGASIRDATRASASVDGSTDREYTFSMTFDEPETQSLTARLTYSTDSGYRRTVQRSTTVDVDPAVVDVAIDGIVTDRGAVDPPLAIDLTNFGNVPLSGVVVQVADEGRTVARKLVGEVPAETTRSIRLNVSGLEDTTLDITANYQAGTSSGEASTTLTYRINPGRVVLTGINLDRSDGYVEITGSASNVGLADVNSVIVRALPADGVEPVPPNREYFVGTVPPSDFVSFDVTAQVDQNVTEIPLEVTYLSSGVERTEQVTVPVDLAPAEQDQPSAGSRGLVFPVVIGLVVLVGVGLIIYLGWSNRGGD